MKKCQYCGGMIHETKVTFDYHEGDCFFIIENVPAEVCMDCGEKTFSPNDTDQILEFVKNQTQPKKTLEVPVFVFAGRN